MVSIDLIQLTLDEMKSRGDFHGSTYAPFYPSSYALHTFNILNQEKKFYYENKQIPNMRLHLLFVGPPMSSKTYYLEHMSQDDNALFRDTGFEMAKKGTMTEAGLCGTIKPNGGVLEKRMGEAEKHKNGFLTIDEFSAIADAYEQSYNATLEAQLLQALDHGNVNKDLGGGSISFKTHCSIWAGIQPLKLHMENDAGLGRRICFMVNIPNKQQLKAIRTAMFRSKNIAPEEGEVEEIHDEIREWRENVDNLKRLTFDDNILDYYIDNNTNPLHQPLSDRLILGYHLAKGNYTDELHVTLDDPMLLKMVQNSLRWFNDVRMGPDIMQIKNLIESYGEQLKNSSYMILENDLIALSSTTSMTHRKMINTIGDMIKMGMLETYKSEKSVILRV